MKDMNRCWVTRLFCFGASNKRPPSPTKWHGDKDHVDSLLKAKSKDKWLKQQNRAKSSLAEEDADVARQVGALDQAVAEGLQQRVRGADLGEA